MIRRKMTAILGLCLIMALFIMGCEGKDESLEGEGFLRHPMEIVGDVESSIVLQEIPEGVEIKTIVHQDKEIQVLSVKSIIEEVGPTEEVFDLLYIAYDGFSARIPGVNLEGAYIHYDQVEGWEAINLYHPVSSNIKGIQRIIILGDEKSQKKGFRVVKPGKSLFSSPIGELLATGNYEYQYQLRGKAVHEVEGIERTAETYYQNRVLPIEKLARDESLQGALVIGSRGEVVPYRTNGEFFLRDYGVEYLVEGESILKNCRGLVIDPPEKKIIDVFHDSIRFLEEGERVLAILNDGFGYYQYEYLKQEGKIPFLQSLPRPAMAMVAYPSISPVNMAASLTGEWPNVNGATERGSRKAEVPTIFQFLLDKGLKGEAVIGPIGTIEYEITPVYSIDLNNDGSTDDEKTANALKIIEEGSSDFIFVHYKDVDEYGHDYGDVAGETLAAIQRTEGYLKQLIEAWDGKVILYSDHGMHSTSDGGDHGSLRYEDLFMPYWMFDGGDVNE